MALVGTPNHRGGTMIVNGVDAPGAGNPTIELDDVSRFNEFLFVCTAGACTALISLDGINYMTAPLAWEDEMSTSPQTRVTALVANRLFQHNGHVKSIRITQTGGTGVVNAVLMCGSD
jgi:hypothetical protein